MRDGGPIGLKTIVTVYRDVPSDAYVWRFEPIVMMAAVAEARVLSEGGAGSPA